MSSKPRLPLAAAIVRQLSAAALFATLVACASAPPAPGREPARARPVVPLDTKVSWLLRLEQERVLRVEQPGSQATAESQELFLAEAIGQSGIPAKDCGE